MQYPTLTKWLNWLENAHPKSWDLNLERISTVADRLELVTPKIPVITVAGTNGKGSTVTMLASIYQAAGFKVGSYTSPHLFVFNERIQINQTTADDETICQAFQTIYEALGDTSLSYFEFGFLAALVIFRQANLDVMILEVGLGGRLDATNIIDADIAIITSIALDHQHWLGDTREAIAREKAGIIKPKSTVIIGEPNPPVTLFEPINCYHNPYYLVTNNDEALVEPSEIKDPAQALFNVQIQQDHWHWQTRRPGMRTSVSPTQTLNSPMTLSKNSLHAQPTTPHDNTHNDEQCDRRSAIRCARSRHTELPIPNLPIQNAATALMAIESLQEKIPVPSDAIKQGLKNASLTGRYQTVLTEPLCILDVAHNPHACDYLAKRLASETRAGKTYAVCAMLADKDHLGSLKPMTALVDHWHLASLDVARGANAKHLGAVLTKLNGSAFTEYTSVSDALTNALSLATSHDRIVVFGSFYTVQQALDTLTS